MAFPNSELEQPEKKMSTASGTENELISTILELLKKNDVTTIVLAGERGAGKTWTAREISMKKDSIIHKSVWINLNHKYDSFSLLESIDRQLSLRFIDEEWEDDVVEEKDRKEKDGVEEKDVEKELIKKISKKFDGLRSDAQKEDKHVLLVLDDIPHQQDVAEIVDSDLMKSLMASKDQGSFKVLITTRDESETAGTNKEIEASQKRFYKLHVAGLSEEESKELLKEIVRKEREEISNSPTFGKLLKVFEEARKYRPYEIIAIANALVSTEQVGDSGVRSSERILERAERILERADNDEKAAKSLLFRAWHDTLLSGVMKDRFWHIKQFFCKQVGVHYNELIAHWIMEGYVGSNIHHIEKAYEEGHKDLMELIDLRMLIKQDGGQDDNMFVMGGIVSSITDHRRRGFNETAKLGLANVFEDTKWEGLGRLAPIDGMIRSPCSPKNAKNVLALLMDGPCLAREVPDFKSMQKLKLFTIFNPRFKSLPSSLTSIKTLSILVLRCCDLLENIDHIRDLENLNVLEISGASCLKVIPDDLFLKMLNLRSLNLSEAKVKSLPSSLFKIIELRWLILRGCDQLETLPSLKSFKKLEVLDLSGALSFQKFKDKTFAPLTKLQTLDLSNSKINHIPLLHNLGEVTRVLLSGCASLTKLPSLNTLPQLQILDVSGATSLKELQDEPLDSLKVLDLSRTQISTIPSSLSHISDLNLQDCSNLVKLPLVKGVEELESLDLSGSSNLAEIDEKLLEHTKFLEVVNFSKVKVKALPSLSALVNLRQLLLVDCSCLASMPEVKALEKLEILDASGCRELKGIQDNSFDNMSHIQTLNLSDTKIESLPFLSKASHLRYLILRNCKNLKKLPPLDHLSELEEFNLCGSGSLVDFEPGILEHKVHLRVLDLSGIPLTKLPSMSGLTNLREFSLKDCSGLETVQKLEALTLLEILDLSGTAIGSLPPLNTFSNLRRLLLKDCSRIEELQLLESLRYLEVLDLSGTGLKKFPYEISGLANLKHLDLPDLSSMHDLDLGKMKLTPVEVNWDQCGIFNSVDTFVDSNKPSLSVSGYEIFPLLDKNPKFWETKFKKFSFFVIKKQGEGGDVYFCKEPFFRDVYSNIRHFSFPEKHDRSLEIHGPVDLPKGFESVLQKADLISLVDNDHTSCLSDLGTDNVKVMKGCWIERCGNVHNILCGEEAVRFGSSLEILWISNLLNLSSLYNGKVENKCFKNLKHLYLDCCPKIVNVFTSSQVPENLEILHVQFCDKLETVFQCDALSKRTLNKLSTLYLLELPLLRSIGMELPDQVDREVIECPKLSEHHPAEIEQVHK